MSTYSDASTKEYKSLWNNEYSRLLLNLTSDEVYGDSEFILCIKNGIHNLGEIIKHLNKELSNEKVTDIQKNRLEIKKALIEDSLYIIKRMRYEKFENKNK